MPLRVWRTDEVTPLAPHPNDPAAGPGPPGSADGQREFLVTFTVTVPAGTPGPAVQDAEAQEAERARELAGQGIWPGCGRCRVRDARWACGAPRTRPRWRPSWPRCRWTPG